MAYGKPALTEESVKHLFSMAKIPEQDFDFYLTYLAQDAIKLINLSNPVVALLDLEEYMEELTSHSLLKILILKLIRGKLEVLSGLGYSLPHEYSNWTKQLRSTNLSLKVVAR